MTHLLYFQSLSLVWKYSISIVITGIYLYICYLTVENEIQSVVHCFSFQYSSLFWYTEEEKLLEIQSNDLKKENLSTIVSHNKTTTTDSDSDDIENDSTNENNNNNIRN